MLFRSENNKLFIPNISYKNNKLALEMFEFIGQLMAMSIRTKLYLSFQFSI
jgi:hypothetical protein